MTVNYRLTITEDDGTEISVDTYDVNKILSFLGNESTSNTSNLDETRIIEIVETWAKDNLPPLPPKEVILKMKDEASNPPKQQQKVQPVSLTM